MLLPLVNVLRSIFRFLSPHFPAPKHDEHLGATVGFARELRAMKTAPISPDLVDELAYIRDFHNALLSVQRRLETQLDRVCDRYIALIDPCPIP